MEHKIILGGERYLPFARRMVQQLRSLGLPYATKTLLVDNVEISVRIEPGHDHIRIEDKNTCLYQFFTTGPNHIPPTEKLPTESYAEFFARIGPVKGFAVRVDIDRKLSKKDGEVRLKGVPVGSTMEKSEDEPPKWKFSTDPRAMYKFLPYRHFQLNALPEHQYFPKSAGGSFVANTWTAANDIADLSTAGVASGFSAVTDILYDTAVDIFKRPGFPRGVNGVAPDADWYRRGATTVVDGQSFGLLTDTSGDLHVFTYDVMDNSMWGDSHYKSQAIKTNIPSKYNIATRIPLPSWCRQHKETPARDDMENHDSLPYKGLRWMFNSSATKMVGIVAHDFPKVINSDVLVESEYSNFEFTRPESITGLVEIDIKIKQDKFSEKGFEVLLSVARSVQPSDNRFIIGADYFFGDFAIKDGEVKNPEDVDTKIKKDALIIMEMDVYHKRPEPADEVDPAQTETLAMVTVKNFDDNTVIRRFTALHSGTPYKNVGIKLKDSYFVNYNREISSRISAAATFVLYDYKDLRDKVLAIGKKFADYVRDLVALNPEMTTTVYAKYEKKANDCIRDMWTLVSESNFDHKDGFKEHVVEAQRLLTGSMLNQRDLIFSWTALIAYDLRVLAFATQNAYFIKDGDILTRQDRMQVIMRNQVVYTEDAPGQEFKNMATQYDVFSKTFATLDWTRLGVSDYYNPSQSSFGAKLLFVGGGGIAIGSNDTRIQITGNRFSISANYPVGPLVYNWMAQRFVSHDPWEVFCIHPAGHWSICTKPLIRYTGPSKLHMLREQRLFDVETEVYFPDQYNTTQSVIDIVSVRVIENDGLKKKWKNIKSTHNDLFNEAYGKSISNNHYNVNISMDLRVTDNVRIHGIKINKDEGDGYFSLWSLIAYLELYDGKKNIQFYTPASYIDMRCQYGMTNGRPLIYNYTVYSSSPYLLTGLLPKPRGACFFGGDDRTMVIV